MAFTPSLRNWIRAWAKTGCDTFVIDVSIAALKAFNAYNERRTSRSEFDLMQMCVSQLDRSTNDRQWSAAKDDDARRVMRVNRIFT